MEQFYEAYKLYMYGTEQGLEPSAKGKLCLKHSHYCCFLNYYTMIVLHKLIIFVSHILFNDRIIFFIKRYYSVVFLII